MARCWTHETAVALDQDIPNELPYNDYFEYFGPDFKLHIAPSNMSNQNTSEYMDKIRSRLLENLRMLPHAPGVQMADIPEDSVDINKEKEAEDEGGEADKDKRLGVKIMDKRVEPENEFESGEKYDGENLNKRFKNTSSRLLEDKISTIASISCHNFILVSFFSS